MIRVMVWAKSRITRAGLESIVAADPRFEIMRADRPPAEFWSMLRECAPDVLLLDAGDEPIARILGRADVNPAATALVAVIDGTRRAEILRVLQSGVRALVLRDSHPQEIAAALQAAQDGLAVMSPEILDVLVPPVADQTDLVLDEPLTARESEVLALLAEGAGNKEIAARLHVSEHTVKFHVSSILGKLGAASRTEAVARGYKEGLILI